MVKYRLQFSKEGETKYVSHLDLVRLFTRAFKRAELPLAYSEGFNPHPKMSIGLPLSVGVTSECEYIEADFHQEVELKELLKRLNRCMPLGVRILAGAQVVLGMRKLSDIALAEYQITFAGTPLTQEMLDAFFGRNEIEMEKKSKRAVRCVNIKEDIRLIRLNGEAEGKQGLTMILSAGSKANLKPDIVLAAMETYIPGFSIDDYDIHRSKIMDEKGQQFI